MDTNTNTNAGITIANRYQFIKLAGRGGMGDVYLAHDLVLGRQVAVKSITSALQGNPEIRRRVERECRLHAALPPHPGIIALYDRIEENGNVYLILEYFEGEPLSAYLERFHKDGRHLPLSAAINIVRQVLDALGHIHAHNILHRDIKPSNVMVTERPNGTYVAKLMDFGIAAPESQENQAMQITMMASAAPGSPTYMAPERIDPDTFGQACPATDLYAVGIMLYEMLCCHPPFQGTLTEIFVAQLSKPVNFDALPPEISSSVKKVLQKTLNKKTAERYGSAAEMISELDTIRRENSRTELELSPKPENIDTAATLLVSDARRSSVMQEAVQEAVAQTRIKRKRRFLMGCAALCLTACVFVLVLVEIFVPVPPECTRECSNFWDNGGKCRWFLSWHNLMWSRKQKCTSDDDWWKDEQLCKDYPGWPERRQKCVSNDWWKYTDDCKTYPSWLERKQKCESDAWWKYTDDCKTYPSWLAQKQKCESDAWWEHTDNCKTYPAWLERKQKCESYDWQYKELCHNYGEWPARIEKCESNDFEKYKQLCYLYPDWQRRRWCLQDNFEGKKQHCKDLPEWHEKMKIWCQQDKYWEKRQYCKDYPKWDEKMKQWCLQDNFWEKKLYCKADPKWNQLMETRNLERERCLKSDFWKQKENNCGKFPEWNDLMKARNQERERCLKGDFEKQNESNCGKFPEWNSLMKVRGTYLELQEQMKQLCLKGNYWENRHCKDLPKWNEQMKVWCLQDNFWGKRQYCEDYPEWNQQMEARNQERERCLRDDFWKQNKRDCDKFPEWNQRMETHNQERERCLRDDFWKQSKSDCGKFPEWNQRMEAHNQEKERCLKGDFWKQSKSDCGKFPEWNQRMEAHNQEKERCLKGDFWKQNKSNCDKFPEWRDKMKELCQSSDYGRYPVCTPYSGTMDKAHVPGDNQRPSHSMFNPLNPPGAKTNTNTKTDINTKDRTKTNTKTDTNTKSRTKTNTKTDTNTKSRTKTNTKTDTNTKSRTKANTKTDTNTKDRTNKPIREPVLKGGPISS